MLIEVVCPVRCESARATPLAQLQRTFEVVAEFDAEPRECRERVDDEPTAVAGDVIALVGSGSVWSAQSTQIGWVTRSSCPQVCASPASVPGWASQKAQPTSVCCITRPPRRHRRRRSSHGGRRPAASTSRTRCRSAREPERGPRERSDEIRVDELIDQVTGLRIVHVRRRNGRGVVDLGEEFGLELFDGQDEVKIGANHPRGAQSFTPGVSYGSTSVRICCSSSPPTNWMWPVSVS